MNVTKCSKYPTKEKKDTEEADGPMGVVKVAPLKSKKDPLQTTLYLRVFFDLHLFKSSM